MKYGIVRDTFNKAIKELNYSNLKFSKKIGVTREHLSSLKNPKVKYGAGPDLISKILIALNKKYKKEDLFFEKEV